VKHICRVIGLAFAFLLGCGLFNVSVLGEPGLLLEEDTWVELTSIQQARCELGAAVVDGKIYALGGIVITHLDPWRSESKVVGTHEMYDPVTNSWIYKASMPAPSNNFAVAVFDDQIYCIGGSWSEAFNWVYNPALDTWEHRATMPFSQEGAQANVVGEKIYLLGGALDGSLNWIYDPLNDTWTQGASMPKSFRGSSSVYEDKIYVVGAYVDPSDWDDADFNPTSEVTSIVQIYDTKTDTWTVTATGGPYCREGLFTISTSGVYAPPKIYCLSYSQRSIGPLIGMETIYENMAFDLETKSWEHATQLPVTRAKFTVVVLDDLVYAIGGYTPDFSRFDGIPLQHIRVVSGLVERYTPLGFGRVAPVVCVLSLKEGGVYGPGEVSLVFGLNRPAVWMGYSLDGGANVTIGGNVTLSGLSGGVYSVRVFAEDKNGNIGASKPITFTVVNAPLPMAFFVAVGVTVMVVGVVCCRLLFLFLRKRRSGSLCIQIEICMEARLPNLYFRLKA